MLLARKRLVDTKRQFENQLRNIMKVFGCILGTTAGRGQRGWVGVMLWLNRPRR
jgi:hypothetical protein